MAKSKTKFWFRCS